MEAMLAGHAEGGMTAHRRTASPCAAIRCRRAAVAIRHSLHSTRGESMQQTSISRAGSFVEGLSMHQRAAPVQLQHPQGIPVQPPMAQTRQKPVHGSRLPGMHPPAPRTAPPAPPACPAGHAPLPPPRTLPLQTRASGAPPACCERGRRSGVHKRAAAAWRREVADCRRASRVRGTQGCSSAAAGQRLSGGTAKAGQAAMCTCARPEQLSGGGGGSPAAGGSAPA